MKLNKKIIRRLIIEEIERENLRIAWGHKVGELRALREELVYKGYEVKTINENIASLFSGLFSRAGGLGMAEFLGPDSESIFGGEEGGFGAGLRTVGEQYLLEAIVRKLQLDPYKGAGLIIKNALERVIRKYSEDDLQRLLSDDDCYDVAYSISKEVLVILEESTKERILKFALDSIGGELGAQFQTAPFTKGIYITINEKFSEAFDDLVNEEEKAKELADIICNTISVENILNIAGESVEKAAETSLGTLGSALDGITDGISDIKF